LGLEIEGSISRPLGSGAADPHSSVETDLTSVAVWDSERTPLLKAAPPLCLLVSVATAAGQATVLDIGAGTHAQEINSAGTVVGYTQGGLD
jgi:hypothetical protein